MDICIIAFEDFTDIDVFLPWDLLNRVPRDDWRVRLLGQGDTATSTVGLTIPLHGPLSEANSADAVLFCSGKGVNTALADDAFMGAFELDDNRQFIGSMCSGALVLAQLGLLQGRPATTYPTRFEQLRGYGVQVIEDQGFVLSGNVATAAGCMAALDLSAWVIESLIGRDMADAVLASARPNNEGCRAVEAA